MPDGLSKAFHYRKMALAKNLYEYFENGYADNHDRKFHGGDFDGDTRYDDVCVDGYYDLEELAQKILEGEW